MILVSIGYTERSEIVILNVYCHDGLSTTPEVITLQEVTTPTNVAEIYSFHTISNFSCYFVPEYSVITAPLRTFTTKNAKFNWDT